jgi:hypothetical protein
MTFDLKFQFTQQSLTEIHRRLHSVHSYFVIELKHCKEEV